MEAGMRRFGALAVIVCLVTLACDKDPARAVKIAIQPPQATHPADSAPKLPTPAPDPDLRRPIDTIVHRSTARGLVTSPRDAAWSPDGCPPPTEEGSGSDLLTVTGPCAFEHREPVGCESLADDFLMTMSRKGARGATVMVFINVEHYKGPGHYDGAQMFVGVQDRTNIYRWSNDEVTMTVGAGEAFAVLPTTQLTAEPMLVRCTGPMTNYQCDARQEATVMEGTVEVLSGTLRCKG
jgi:hypothetical protein